MDAEEIGWFSSRKPYGNMGGNGNKGRREDSEEACIISSLKRQKERESGNESLLGKRDWLSDTTLLF